MSQVLAIDRCGRCLIYLVVKLGGRLRADQPIHLLSSFLRLTNAMGWRRACASHACGWSTKFERRRTSRTSYPDIGGFWQIARSVTHRSLQESRRLFAVRAADIGSKFPQQLFNVILRARQPRMHRSCSIGNTFVLETARARNTKAGVF